MHIKEADNSHSLAGTAMERTRKNSNEKAKKIKNGLIRYRITGFFADI